MIVRRHDPWAIFPTKNKLGPLYDDVKQNSGKKEDRHKTLGVISIPCSDPRSSSGKFHPFWSVQSYQIICPDEAPPNNFICPYEAPLITLKKGNLTLVAQ